MVLTGNQNFVHQIRSDKATLFGHDLYSCLYSMQYQRTLFITIPYGVIIFTIFVKRDYVTIALFLHPRRLPPCLQSCLFCSVIMQSIFLKESCRIQQNDIVIWLFCQIMFQNEKKKLFTFLECQQKLLNRKYIKLKSIVQKWICKQKSRLQIRNDIFIKRFGLIKCKFVTQNPKLLNDKDPLKGVVIH